jgi:hypothetical protein
VGVCKNVVCCAQCNNGKVESVADLESKADWRLGVHYPEDLQRICLKAQAFLPSIKIMPNEIEPDEPRLARLDRKPLDCIIGPAGR